MSSELGTSSSCATSLFKELDRKMCIICQGSTLKKGTLVKNPKTESYQKLLNAVEERANLQDGVYVGINGYLKEMSNEHSLKISLCGIVAVILMPQMQYQSSEQGIV